MWVFCYNNHYLCLFASGVILYAAESATQVALDAIQCLGMSIITS